MNCFEWRRRWRYNCSLLFVLACLFICLISKLQQDFAYRSQDRQCLPRLRVERSKASNSSQFLIPRIIHQTWSNDKLPDLFKPWMKSWLNTNPDWEYWFWTDEDIRLFIRECYPNFEDTFNSYPGVGYRADAFRYFVLYEHGGFYADIDMEALTSMDTVAKEHHCILGQEPLEHAHFLGPLGIPLVSNAIMGCRAHHPFFKMVVNDLNNHLGHFRWNDILYATGPYMLTKEYHKYGRPSSDRMNVTLAEPEVFMPTIDQSMLRHIRDTCMRGDVNLFMWASLKETRGNLCNNLMSTRFSNSPSQNSITNHHWTHTWATAKHDPWGVKNIQHYFDIQEIFPNK